LPDQELEIVMSLISSADFAIMALALGALLCMREC
jgi:hypothetical protein